MYVISIINLKGGVGKTTTSVNLSYILAQVGYRVLLVDNDKQGNASKMFGCWTPDGDGTVARMLLMPDAGMEGLICRTDYENLDIVPANMELLTADMRVMLDVKSQQQTRYRKALKGVQDNYDFCVIDNAPDINMGVINGLVAANSVIVPVVIDQWSVDGLDPVGAGGDCEGGIQSGA